MAEQPIITCPECEVWCVYLGLTGTGADLWGCPQCKRVYWRERGLKHSKALVLPDEQRQANPLQKVNGRQLKKHIVIDVPIVAKRLSY